MKKSDFLMLDFFGLELECTATDVNGTSISDATRFNFYSTEICGQKFLIARYLGEPVGAAQMDAFLSRFSKLSGLYVIVYLDSITYSRRTSYMKKGIAFVVRDKQIFAPFLGMSLVKRCDTENPEKGSSELKLSTQLLLLYYLHSDKDILKMTEANKVLGYSRMTLSRSGRELTETGLFEIYKEGNANVLKGLCSKREIFEELSKRFTAPDKFIGYLTADKIDSEFTYGGLDALAQRSMLGFGQIAEYATGKKDIEVADDYIDENTAVRIYQWKYDPLMFSADNCIDPLSIAISLKDNNDERVRECIEEMLDEFWKGK